MVFVSGEKILFWMEVLGVCKYIGEADRALTSVEGWLQVSVLYCRLIGMLKVRQQGKPEQEDALMFIQDGIKFVQNFAGVISESTPHLYLSGLSFLPSRSVLANMLTMVFPNTAQVAKGQHEDWPSNQHILRGHIYPVCSVAFSPDGRHIVSGSEDHIIQVLGCTDRCPGGQPSAGVHRLS